MNVTEAVQHDLDDLAERAPLLATSGLAAAALALAEALDDPTTSATAKSNCADALLKIETRLRDLAPEKEEHDLVDDLKARRAKRREGKAAAKG